MPHIIQWFQGQGGWSRRLFDGLIVIDIHEMSDGFHVGIDGARYQELGPFKTLVEAKGQANEWLRAHEFDSPRTSEIPNGILAKTTENES